jgi:hypothetical protein
VNDLAEITGEVQGSQSLDERDLSEPPDPEERVDEGKVLLTAGDELGDAQVMALETESGLAVGVR